MPGLPASVTGNKAAGSGCPAVRKLSKKQPSLQNTESAPDRNDPTPIPYSDSRGMRSRRLSSVQSYFIFNVSDYALIGLAPATPCGHIPDHVVIGAGCKPGVGCA